MTRPLFDPAEAVALIPVEQPVYAGAGPKHIPTNGEPFWAITTDATGSTILYREFIAVASENEVTYSVETTYGRILTSMPLATGRAKLCEITAPGDLQRGTVLTSLYAESNGSGYVALHPPKRGASAIPRYRIVLRDVWGTDLGRGVVHHRDEDKWNDAHENLQWLRNQESHNRLHAVNRRLGRANGPSRTARDVPGRQQLSMIARRLLDGPTGIAGQQIVAAIAAELDLNERDVARAIESQYGTPASLVHAGTPRNVEVVSVTPVDAVPHVLLVPMDPTLSDERLVLPYVGLTGHFQRMPLVQLA